LARRVDETLADGREAGRPTLTEMQMLEWDRAWRMLYGDWPSKNSGQVGNAGDNRLGIDSALRHDHCGLVGGSSLSHLLPGMRAS
jgi:hypothetical protein